MEEQTEVIQSSRRLNYHDDIVLRTPTQSTGERLIAVCFKNQPNTDSILEFEYPKHEKDFQEILRNLRWQAERNILAIQTVRSLNGLFGLRCFSFNTVTQRNEMLQSSNIVTVHKCSLVEMPETVSHLLFAGEIRIFNFVESMNPLNIRKEIGNCLPAAFQFWATPKIRKSLDEKISVLVFGGNLLKKTESNEPTDKGFVAMLLVIVRLLDHFLVCQHFSEDFSKDQLIDSGFEKLNAMPKDKVNTFLIQEFERILSEINCPSDYLLDIFIKDIFRDDYVLEKSTYRKRRNFLLIYRGTLFLLEKRFQTFMNVTLVKQIIQECNLENPSNEEILCLIRAGMVLTLTKIWRVFVQERDFSGSIAKTMEKAKRNIPTKTKVYTSKKAGTDVVTLKAKRSSESSSKIDLRKTKKQMVLVKSDSKDQFPMDDIQSKRTSTTSVDVPQEINECYSEFVEGSGETIDSQETISEPEVYSNVLDNQKLENDAVEKRSDFSANFQGETDILNPFYISESSESVASTSDYSDSQSHGGNKDSASEDYLDSDKIGRAETNLKRSGKYAPRSKSVSVNTVPEANLANLDRKVSGNTNSPIFDTESKLAVDNPNRFNNSITNITTNIHSSVDVMGAGTGNTPRNLRPRYQTDKLSKSISKILLNII